MTRPALSLEITIGGETHEVPYTSLDSCLGDNALITLLDNGAATCRLRCGSLVLTGRPVSSGDELREAIVHHSRTILRARGGE